MKGIIRKSTRTIRLNLRFLVILALIIGVKKSQAQSFPNNGHYMLNQLRYNPGFAGAEKGLNVLGNFRGQWIGLEGAPFTGNLSADVSLPNWNSAVGLNISSDFIGIQQAVIFELSYAYRQKIKATTFGFGVGVGFESLQFDGTKIITSTGDYSGTTIDHNDDVLPDDIQNKIRPLVAVGISALHSNFSVGVSFRNIVDLTSNFMGPLDTVTQIIKTLNYQQGRTLQFFGKYDISIKDRFGLSPSVQLLTDFSRFQTDISLMFNYDDFIFAGFSARGYNKPSFDALIPIVGVKLRKNIGVFYSYEIGMSRLKQAANGTHEVSISYFLSEKKLFGGGKVINNPRFL